MTTDVNHRILRERFSDLRRAMLEVYRLAAERSEFRIMARCSSALRLDRQTAGKCRKSRWPTYRNSKGEVQHVGTNRRTG